METLETTVRLRLQFEDRHILSKSQRSEGLKRSWILLKPHHRTIIDLSSYLLHIFQLQDACPNGLLLSMDGFVLPPFESTCILKDKDIICVKKKRGTLSDVIKVGDGENSLEEEEIVEKQPVVTGVKLLANEEFEKGTGGYESESEEDEHEQEQPEDTLHLENSLGGKAVSKKRKASKKLQSSKRKKKHLVIPESVENDVHIEQIESFLQDRFVPQKSLKKKEKLSDFKSNPDITSSLEISGSSNSESTPSAKRCGKLQDNGTRSLDVPHMPDESIKLPSRSARRKKAKRQWLRELAKAEKKELLQRPSPEKDMHKKTTEHQQPDQNSDVEDDIVPVVIRPGHIRFEPLGKDQTAQKNEVRVETFQWNGITSKKKGQKWGKEKISSCRRNDYKDINQECSEMLTIEEKTPVNDPINFDKLAPFASLPKESDIIAYRLLELTSSWCPELSSFRVGKISWFEPESNRVKLIPVPEYPIIFEKKIDEDASALQPDTPVYSEDGSLEIDFSSLVDVRIIKHGDSDPAKAVTGSINENPVGNHNAVSGVGPIINNGESHAPTPENGEVNGWDEISQVLSAKKAQLSREDGWSKESSGRSSWSYKALRSSAMGPTMAFLRAQNDI